MKEKKEEVNLHIFVPAEYVEAIQQALHEAGAGVVGNYDHCMSVVDTRGSWKPLEGADPHTGTVGEIFHGQECRIEARCPRERVPEALERVHRAHPYEEPLINVVPLLNHLYKVSKTE